MKQNIINLVVNDCGEDREMVWPYQEHDGIFTIDDTDGEFNSLEKMEKYLQSETDIKSFEII